MIAGRASGVDVGDWVNQESVSALSIEFADGLDHGDEIGNGRLRLDVVDGVEDEAAALREDLAAPQHLLADLGGGSERRTFCVSTPAAPEDDAVAVFFLEELGRPCPRRSTGRG